MSSDPVKCWVFYCYWQCTFITISIGEGVINVIGLNDKKAQVC
jgi:hypothetical protein